MTDLYVSKLRYNGLCDPIGVATEAVTLSWKILGNGLCMAQTACRIQISENEDFSDPIYETVEKTNLPQWEFNETLPEKTKFFWRVKVAIKLNAEHEVWLDWSDTATFETALCDGAAMGAKWIEADEEFYLDAKKIADEVWKHKIIPAGREDEDPGLLRCPYFKKKWVLKENPQKARVYITARGLYELYINGEKIGNYKLAPDFTPYDKLMYYQTYDISGDLKAGENRIEVILGDGWYVGHAQETEAPNHLYGERPSFICRAEATYTDGSQEILVSDQSFDAYTGPLVYADMYMGECYDATQTPQKYGTIERDYPLDVLYPQEYGGILEKHVLCSKEIHQLEDGAWVIDFGQVMAGRERIHFLGEAGSLAKIEYSEIMDVKTRDIMQINTRHPFHEQTNYIKITEDDFWYEPRFSFQGYRYVKISGLQNPLTKEQCYSIALESGMQDTCYFKCSNPDINQLVKNAYWSQCGNMLSVPMDCPTRERGGYNGDAQVFLKAAIWQQDVLGFFRRWLKWGRMEQLSRGQIPVCIPYTKAFKDVVHNEGNTAAGWTDAIIYIPQDLYRAYGNKAILEENYNAMERWMEYVIHAAADDMPDRFWWDVPKRKYMKYLWNTGAQYGDWLAPIENFREVTRERTTSLFFYRMAAAMEEISRILGKTEREQFYRELKENIIRCFYVIYMQEDGLLDQRLQSPYILALAFGILKKDDQEKCAAELNKMVIENDYRMATGFLSTPFILDVLWDNGYYDTAAQILYQDKIPSWLYMVKNGATTIWEEWDGIQEDGTVKGTSFNHYARGCVADFIYRRFSGIEVTKPGLSEICLSPQFTEGLTDVEFSYECIYGTLTVKWKKAENYIDYQVTIPCGMTLRLGMDAKQENAENKWEHLLKGTYLYNGTHKLRFMA